MYSFDRLKFQALKEYQAKYSDLRYAYQACQKRIKELEHQIATRPPAAEVRSAIKRYDEDVKLHAKKFIILHELFAPVDDSFFSQDQPSVDLWGSGRYDNATSRSKAILAELYFAFPERTHDLIRNHSRFGQLVCLPRDGSSNIKLTVCCSNQFCSAAKAIKSHTIERARDVGGPVYGLPAEYFVANYDRSNIPELVALLKFDVSKSDVSKFAPILYPREHRTRRKDSEIFLSDEIPLVNFEVYYAVIIYYSFSPHWQLLRAILFGKASLSRKTKYAKRNTVGVTWGIQPDDLFYGAIATAAVIVCFIS